MGFKKEDLDVVLIPCGLTLMFGYHLFLLFRYLRLPHTTVMGFENHDKRAWIHSVMQVEKDIRIFLGVISSNVLVATFFSLVSLTLSFLIGAWMSSSSSNNFLQSELIYGDTTPTTMSIKYVSLLVFFLLAFSCFVQSSRSYVHANYLISIPGGSNNSVATAVTKAAKIAVLRGSDFWSVGLRSLYFALVLLFWFFRPIPIFTAFVAMVIVLYYLDYNNTLLIEHRFATEVEERISESVTEVAMAIQVHRQD